MTAKPKPHCNTTHCTPIAGQIVHGEGELYDRTELVAYCRYRVRKTNAPIGRVRFTPIFGSLEITQLLTGSLGRFLTLHLRGRYECWLDIILQSEPEAEPAGHIEFIGAGDYATQPQDTAIGLPVDGDTS